MEKNVFRHHLIYLEVKLAQRKILFPFHPKDPEIYLSLF